VREGDSNSAKSGAVPAEQPRLVLLSAGQRAKVRQRVQSPASVAVGAPQTDESARRAGGPLGHTPRDRTGQSRADIGPWHCHDCWVNAVEVVGREAELRSVSGFLDRAADGPAAFVLEGESGIGKSTLWRAAVTAARWRDLTVLSARPAEAERGLAHVGLGDLFDNVLDDVLPELLAPRRRALETALLREEGSDEPVDYRALVVAVRDVLQLLSDRRSLLVAVDDVPWLDASSSSALAFALRRLGDSRVRVLLAGDWPVTSSRRSSSAHFHTSAWSDCLWERSVSARFIGCCATALAEPSRGRRYCASTSARAEIPSTR
jgi:AAA ATPase domain